MVEALSISLKALSNTASTSRVLNLSRVSAQFKDQDDYHERRFFNDPVLNRAIIVKQRLRSDETFLLPRSQPVATKIIFPFDAMLLESGGRSIFVGQTGYEHAMHELLGNSTRATRQDLDLLTLLETLPSLDPFLLKEHLAQRKIYPADCYFDISIADTERMRTFVSEQIGALIYLAFGSGSGEADSQGVSKLVDALMTREADERLDPLRLTLGLEGQAFKDGVFSWKGFLYYKWKFSEIAKKLSRVVSELEIVRFSDKPSPASVQVISKQRVVLSKSIRSAARDCTGILCQYDEAFGDLLNKGKAVSFRQFLLQAPKLFVELGSRMANIAHIESSWAHRFPNFDRLTINSDEFSKLLADYQHSLQPETKARSVW